MVLPEYHGSGAAFLACACVARFADTHPLPAWHVTDANRGKAISVATLGFPLTETVFPLTVVAVSAVVGWQTSWLVVPCAGWIVATVPVSVAVPQYLWQPLDVSAAQRHTVEMSPSSISTSGWTRER